MNLRRILSLLLALCLTLTLLPMAALGCEDKECDGSCDTGEEPGGGTIFIPTPNCSVDVRDRLVRAAATPTLQDGVATFTPNSAAENAILAVAEGKDVDFDLDSSGVEASSYELTLSKEFLQKLAKTIKGQFKIITRFGNICITKSELKALAEKAERTVTIRIASEDEWTTEVDVGVDKKADKEEPTELELALSLIRPVENASSGLVARIINEDGTWEVVRKTAVVAEGLSIPLTGSAKVEIIDNSRSFTDVAEDHWASDAIDFATSRELFYGTSDTTFTPEGSMTRAMIAQVLHNLDSNPDHSYTGSFPDTEDHWAQESVSWAAEKGIISGRPDGTFGADTSVTRQDAAVMLWRYAGSPTASGSLDDFSDSPQVAGYAQAAMAWGTELGMIGSGSTALRPTEAASRAEIAAMLMNLINSAAVTVE